MEEKRTLALFLAAVMVFAVFVVPAEAAKAKPTSEPSGNLVITSADQLVAKVPGYVRVYNWQNGQYSHVWSGVVGDNMNPTAAAIGDVDNDGVDEVIASNFYNVGSSYTYQIKIWRNGDSSSSPSITIPMTVAAPKIAVADVDGDGANELVVRQNNVKINVFDCTSTSCTSAAIISNVGTGALTIGDADNDGTNEMITGMASPYCRAAVIKYSGGAYSIVAYLGQSASGCCIDEVSIGDLDGVSGNELFGSGYCNGNLYIWQYSNGAYNQLWNVQHKKCYDQSNEIADIDGDGANEIVFTSNSQTSCGSDAAKVFVYEYNGNTWVKSATIAGLVTTPVDMAMSGNPDGDGVEEVVIFNTVWDWVSGAFTKIQTYADTTVKAISVG